MCAVLTLHVQTLDVCEKEAVEVEGVALTEEDAVAEEEEAEVEVAVSEDIAIPETVAAEEQVVEAEQVVVSAEVEAAAHEVVTDAVVEVVTEISEPEREVTEPAAPPAEEDEAEVLAEEEAPEVTAEADATTEVEPFLCIVDCFAVGSCVVCVQHAALTSVDSIFAIYTSILKTCLICFVYIRMLPFNMLKSQW